MASFWELSLDPKDLYRSVNPLGVVILTTLDKLMGD